MSDELGSNPIPDSPPPPASQSLASGHVDEVLADSLAEISVEEEDEDSIVEEVIDEDDSYEEEVLMDDSFVDEVLNDDYVDEVIDEEPEKPSLASVVEVDNEGTSDHPMETDDKIEETPAAETTDDDLPVESSEMEAVSFSQTAAESPVAETSNDLETEPESVWEDLEMAGNVIPESKDEAMVEVPEETCSATPAAEPETEPEPAGEPMQIDHVKHSPESEPLPETATEPIENSKSAPSSNRQAESALFSDSEPQRLDESAATPAAKGPEVVLDPAEAETVVEPLSEGPSAGHQSHFASEEPESGSVVEEEPLPPTPGPRLKLNEDEAIPNPVTPSPGPEPVTEGQETTVAPVMVEPGVTTAATARGTTAALKPQSMPMPEDLQEPVPVSREPAPVPPLFASLASRPAPLPAPTPADIAEEESPEEVTPPARKPIFRESTGTVNRPPPPTISSSIYSQDEDDPTDELGERTADESPTLAQAALVGAGIATAATLSQDEELVAATPGAEPSEEVAEDAAVEQELDGGPLGPDETEEVIEQSDKPVGDETAEEEIFHDSYQDEPFVEESPRAGEYDGFDPELGDDPEQAAAVPDDKDVFMEEEEEDEQKWQPSKIEVCLIVSIIVAVIVLVVTLPILLLRRNQSADKSVPTPAPSLVPPKSPISGSPSSAPFPGQTDYAIALKVSEELLTIGSAVAIDGALAVFNTGIGESLMTFIKRENEWVQLSGNLMIGQDSSAFGYSIDLFDGGMIVGAPTVYASDTTESVGAAFFYSFDSATSSWTQVGGPLGGVGGIDSFEEGFGTSVARSGVLRLAVGAPYKNFDDGAVYTFEIAQLGEFEFDWVPMASLPITTIDSKEQLGTDVDFNFDGDRLAAGAAAANKGGSFYVYLWNDVGSEWIEVPVVVGDVPDGQAFGASVTFLSASGDVLAVGGSGASTAGTGGLVRVYKQASEALQYEQLGPDLIGDQGEYFGGRGTVSGVADADGVFVDVGTSKGQVKRFRYDDGVNEWIQSAPTIETGFDAVVTAVSTTDGLKTVAVGIASESTALIFASDAGTIKAPVSVPAVEPTTTPVSGKAPSAAPVAVAAPTASPLAVESPTTAPIGFMAPTEAPIATSPPVIRTWTSAGGPFVGSSVSDLGSSVAIGGSTMAIGAPSGLVQVYNGTDGAWNLAQELLSDDANSLFGFSVAVSRSGGNLVVGAPSTLSDQSDIPMGAAYFYQLNNNGQWVQRGPPIRGNTTAFSANGNFGYAVDVSLNGVVVAGAPLSNEENVLRRGRVYTFELDGGSWVARSSDAQLVGEASDDLLGSAVAISGNGLTMVAGAPGAAGGDGAAIVYQWTGNFWLQAGTLSGDAGGGEGLGAAVSVLSLDGATVAAGGFGYGGGQGVIRVYRRQEGVYEPLGSPIVGAAGDNLGAAGSFAGSIDASVPTILASTASGQVKTFTYNSSTSKWEETIAALNTGLSSSPAVSGTTSQGSLVVGGNNEAQVYKLTSGR